jgi:hypothetical protein
MSLASWRPSLGQSIPQTVWLVKYIIAFVSVAAKGLSHAVSPLFATLARKCISVASKGVMGEANLYRSNSCGSEGGGEAASLV